MFATKANMNLLSMLTQINEGYEAKLSEIREIFDKLNNLKYNLLYGMNPPLATYKIC
jgi:hypothetical protein